MIQVETVKRHDGATIDCIRDVAEVGGLVDELDRLKSENEKLRGLVKEAYLLYLEGRRDVYRGSDRAESDARNTLHDALKP